MLIGIFVFTTVIASALALYFGVNASKTEVSSTTQPSALSNNDNTPSTEVQIKEVEKEVVIPSIYTAKQSTKNDKTYRLNSRTSRGVVVTLDEKNNVEVLFNNDTLELYPNLTQDDISKSHTVTGFSSKVVDVQVVPLDAYSQDSVILFLLDNKTVEYVKLSDLCENKNFDKVNSISGVSKVIKIDSAIVKPQAVTEGITSPIAFDENGNFYDLTDYIK